MSTCVVCEQRIHQGSERYANSWEATRKRSPCCSSACSASFDPDVHWVPGVLPSPPERGEEDRLLKIARRRLAQGDRPRVVVREMLLAGVSVPALRKACNQALVARARARQDATTASFLGGVLGVIAAMWSIRTSPSTQESTTTEDALTDLDRWEQRAKATAEGD